MGGPATGRARRSLVQVVFTERIGVRRAIGVNVEPDDVGMAAHRAVFDILLVLTFADIDGDHNPLPTRLTHIGRLGRQTAGP